MELRGHVLGEAAPLSRRIEALMRRCQASPTCTVEDTGPGLTRAQVAQPLETYLLE